LRKSRIVWPENVLIALFRLFGRIDKVLHNYLRGIAKVRS